MNLTREDRRTGWLLVLPGVLLILAFSIYPLVYAGWVAFVNYDFQVPGHAFVGLGNFAEIFADPVAGAALRNTLVLSVACVAVEVLLGLALALSLAERFRGRAVLMPLFLMPLFISPVIVGQLWSLMLARPFGPVNWLLGADIGWLTEWPWTYVSLVVADAWQWTALVMVVLLAGLTAIPHERFEAASIDGAGPWRTFRSITLPALLPSLLVAVGLRGLDAVRLFDTIFMMTGGGPGTSTYTASFYLYQIGFQQFHLSKATAGAWVFLLVTAIPVTVLVRRLLRAEPA